MTEKSYGGNNGVREHIGKPIKVKENTKKIINDKISKSKRESSINEPVIEKKIDSEFEDYIKAGKILIEARNFAKDYIKRDKLLLEIAREIENKIRTLGGEIAFPVNLSIDDIAAHYHPTVEDTRKAEGLLKIDIGVHVNGSIADSAFSMDLTEDGRYKELIKASEDALESSLNLLQKNPNSTLNEVGKSIKEAIQNKGFSPIINLSGHSLERYNLHAGITIPNYPNNSSYFLESGAYAIEPFATIGEGKVIDGPSSNIYSVINIRNPRGPTARKILEYIAEKYKTLPFSLREIQEKFGPMARLGLRELEQLKIVHNYPQLIEITHKPVSQAEHTIIKTKSGKIIVTTR